MIPATPSPTARRRLVVLALVVGATLLFAGALVPTAAAAPTANCTLENVETYPDPGDTADLNSSGSSGDYVLFDVDGDGSTDTDSYPPGYVYEATYNETGTYEPAVVAVNETGDTFTSDRDRCGNLTVENNTAPSVAFDISPNPAKVNETVTFTANASDTDGYIAFYEWRIDGEIVGESDVITETFEVAGSYGIELTVTDNDGATATELQSLRVFENQPPEAALTANRTTVDDGDTVRFDASNSTDDDGSVVLYEWDFDGDGVEDLNTEVSVVSHTYETTPGEEWNASVTVVDENDANDTASVVLGRPNESPVVDITYDPKPPLAGENVTFTADAADPDGSVESYEWRIDGQVVSRRASFEYVFESAGTRNVVLIATDDDNATDRDNETVVVDSGNEPPVARAAPNRTIVPAGGSDGVAFDASGSSEPDDSIASYEWDFGVDGDVDGTGVRATGSFPPADQRRTVPVRLRVTDTRGATDTVQFLITVAAGGNQRPVAAFSVSPSLPLPGEPVTLNATAASDPDGAIGSYEWDIDGDGTPEERGPTVTVDVSRITANATLTVTDDDGDTDTASRAVETGLVTINVTGTVAVGGGGLVYLNEPPNASFRASLPNADAGDEVRFTSTSFDSDGNVTGWTWYVDGSTVSDAKSCEGVPDPCIPDPDFRPEDVSVTFENAGTYNVTLVVTDDDNGTDRATRQFTVGQEGADDPTAAFTVGRFFDPNLTTGPVLLGEGGNETGAGANAETQATGLFTIEAGEDTLFDASDSTAVGNRTITSYYWTLDQKNGTGFRTLYGEKVTAAFPAKGEYEVTLEVTDSTGESARATQNVTVAERNEVPEITSVTPDRTGAPLEGVSLRNTYTVEVASADPIDRVEFELAGRGKVDATGGDGWSGQFDLGRLNGDATLTITAYDEEGDSDRVTRSVEIVRTPGWVDSLIQSGSVRVRENSPTEIVITKRIPQQPIDVRIDPDRTGIPVFSRFSDLRFTADSRLRLVYDMRTQTVTVQGRGAFTAEFGQRSESSRLQVRGTVGIDSSENWHIRNLRVVARNSGDWTESVSASVSNNFGGVPVKVSGRASATLALDRDIELAVQLGRRGGTLALTGGRIAVGLRAGGTSASVSGQACYTGVGSFCVGAKASAYVRKAALGGALRFQTGPFRVNPGLQFNSRVRVSANIAGFSPSKTFTFGGQIGSTPISVLSAGDAREGPAATPTRLGGSDTVGTERARALDLAERPQSVASAGVTDDGVRDGPPAVAARDGTYTAVWARQDPDGDPGETDVYAATSADGTAWSAPAPVADGERIAYEPDIAAAGGRRAAVWTRTPLPGNDTTAAELRANTSLALAVDDGSGSGWAAPVTIEDGNESAPVVAAAGDRFLVAWLRDPDGNRTTAADREVRWAVYNASAGSLGARRTVPNATTVAVAGGPNGFTLAYLESDDGRNGSVVRAELTDGGLVEAARHPASGVRDLTAGPRSVVWTSLTDNGTVLRHAPAGESAATVSTIGVVNVGSPTLLVDAGQPVVAYLGTRPSPNASRAVFAQRRADGEWLSPRPLTSTSGPVDRTVGPSGATVADGGLVAVTATENVTTDRPGDVVATRLGLAPDLTVSAASPDLAGASAGDRVTVNYTVRNVGDRAVAGATTVAVETPSGTAATETIGGLAVGDRANGSVTVRLGETGRLTVRGDAGGAVEEADESNNAARLATARPDLRVSAADVTRERRGGDLLVTVDVRNRGPVPVANATVRLRSGNETVAETQVDVPDNGRRTARLRVPIDAIDRSAGDAVVVDPAGAIAETDERNNAAGVRLLAVDLGLRDAVGAGPAPGGAAAVGFVSNAGPVGATAEVTVDGNGTALTYAVPVEAPGPGGGERLEAVRLYHPTGNGTLDLRVTPRRGRDTESFDNAVRTVANVSGNGTAPILVTGAEAPGNGTVAVDLANPGNVTAGVPLRIAAGTATVAETTVVLEGGATETVRLNVSTDAAELTAVVPGSQATAGLAAAPDVNGNGRAATDPDGDGQFEDVDGSGDFSIVDVAVLLDRFDDPAVQDNAGLFDFDGSGGVNIVDVAALLDQT